MAAAGYTPLLIYGSTTASNTPLAANLTTSASGVELAINAADGKLFYKDSGGVVQVLATKGTGPIGGSNTQVQYNSSGALAGSANLTFDGTTLTANALTTTSTVTINGGTANGVAYLNGSKVLTTGSALTFDGSTFSLSGGAITSTDSAGNARSKFEVFTNGQTNNQVTLGQGFAGPTDNVGYLYNRANAAFVFGVNNTEQMRLTSTGLGIGTSSPGYKLHVDNSANSSNWIKVSNGSNGAGAAAGVLFGNDGGDLGAMSLLSSANSPANSLFLRSLSTNPLVFGTNNTERMRLDSSGNLGLGVTPSGGTYPALEFGSPGIIRGNGDMNIASNAYFNAGWKYKNNGTATLFLQTSGQNQWYTAPSGTAGNAISWTQAMTLDASGNLVVGGTSAVYTNSNRGNISINGASTAILALSTGGTGRAYLYSDGSRLDLLNTQNDALTFGTNNTERARITSGGDLLVGKTGNAPTVDAGIILDPTGAVKVTRTGSDNTTFGYELYSTGAAAYRFYVGMGGTIYATNTTITAISDQRLKENIQDLDVGLNDIMALKPRKFDWKAGKGKDIKGDRGWIAQEFEQVFPDMVSEWKDPAPEGEKPYKAVSADLIPVLVKAIQELKAEVDSLKAQLKGA